MPRYTKPRKTWQSITYFRVKSVQRRLQDGIQFKKEAEGLGVRPFILPRWLPQFERGALIRGNAYESMGGPRHALRGYINQFYNTVWLHSGLDYLSPMEFEQLAA